MIILEDTRQQIRKHKLKHEYFEKHGIVVKRTKLWVGDYTLPTDQSICIDTKFSRETFISEDNGRHLPLYAHTTISFKYWLNPAPNLEFLSILGTELFGDSMITSAQVST